MKVNSKTVSVCVFLSFALFALVCSVSATSSAASITVKVQTNKALFPAGINTILVSGNVTPAPGISNTYVAVTITTPTGALADANQFPVSGTTGAFNGTFVTGGPTYDSYGTYTIKAVYNNASGTATFVYGSNATTTSSSRSTSSSTSVSLSSATTSSSTSSSVSTTSTTLQTSTSSSSSTSSSPVTTSSSSSVHPSTTSSSSSTAFTDNYLLVVLAFLLVGAGTLLMRTRK